MLAQGTGKPILTSPYSRKKCAEVSKTSRSPTTRPGNPSPNIYRRFIQHAFGTKKNRNPRGLQPSEAVSGAGSFPASIGLRAHDAKREGPSTDLNVIFSRLKKLAAPYWSDPKEGKKAILSLVLVLTLTVSTTAVSVIFNFLERDFMNSLVAKNPQLFRIQLFKYLAAFAFGIPVFVFATYFRNKLSLAWRKWMTREFMGKYMENRTYYQIQTNTPLDNPDQRIATDIKVFTESAMSISLTILNAFVDLCSFSKILFSIYPPLFVTLVFYAIGGTSCSIWLGRSLVGLNFQQEVREADFRYGLFRLRENAESIAFYGGEKKEGNLILERVRLAVDNFAALLRATRTVEFFTMFYQYIIILLPAAVLAPLYFKGQVELGVVTQTEFAFSHVLKDVSLVVFQLQTLAGFSAVIDRLGQFQEVMNKCGDKTISSSKSEVLLEDNPPGNSTDPLLELKQLTLMTPDSGSTLVKALDIKVLPHQSVLIMGPSGAGKTSLLRAIAGLWTVGSGRITRFGTPIGLGDKDGDIMFVPQKPYLVLGSLRDQLLYPTWADTITDNSSTSNSKNNSRKPQPTDSQLEDMLGSVNLHGLLQRCKEGSKRPLDVTADWSTQLSLGEQQRLGFARILLSQPRLILMDEATSALDTDNEKSLYEILKSSGITYVSIGHRSTLKSFHEQVLEIIPGGEKGDPSWKTSPCSMVPN